MIMPNLSPGQHNALIELERVAEACSKVLSIRGYYPLGPDGSLIGADLVIRTGSPDDGTCVVHGVEPVTVRIPADFPFRPPGVKAGHDRFAGLLHVQWRRWICLYGSESDWNPSDGMLGFLSRLIRWYDLAASDKRPDPTLPWDPPMAYRDDGAGCVIVRANIPDTVMVPHQPGTALAIMSWKSDQRTDVVGWLDTGAGETELIHELDRHRLLSAGPPSRNTDTFLAAVVSLASPVGVEFPETVANLVNSFDTQDVRKSECEALLIRVRHVNRRWARRTQTAVGPLYLLAGSPSPHPSAPHHVAHLAAWRLEGETVGEVSRLANEQSPDARTRAGYRPARRRTIMR